MYKLLIAFSLTLIVAGCSSSHRHPTLQDHWHSCDGELTYTAIEYDDMLQNCRELMKEDILEELKRNAIPDHDFHHEHNHSHKPS